MPARRIAMRTVAPLPLRTRQAMRCPCLSQLTITVLPVELDRAARVSDAAECCVGAAAAAVVEPSFTLPNDSAQ